MKFQTSCGKQTAIAGSLKQIAGNKMQLPEVPNKLWGTKCNCRKLQTNCAKQNAVAGSPKQELVM